MSVSESVGAYGLRLEGIDGRLLLTAPTHWPSLRVTQKIVRDPATPNLQIQEDGAVVPLVGGGRVRVVRDPAGAHFALDRRLSDDELVHPYLGPVAGLQNHWLGRQAFHGGAVMIGGAAWGIIGSRQAGKSSLLAEAAGRGMPVVSDDLLVVDGTDLFAGPRSVDLRRSAALHFGMGRPLGVVGRRERWRVELPAVPVTVPLGGWVFLRWGEEATTSSVGLGDRLSLLAANRTVKVKAGSENASSLLRLAALPALQLTGVKRWDQLGPLLDRLLEAIKELPR